MKVRWIIGNICIMITVVFTVYLSLVMTHRIQTVVQKGAAMRVFRYELLACVIFFLCALDLRSGIFTLKGTLPLKMLGWLLRIAVVTVTAVLLYFIGRVTAGSFIRSKRTADNALVLGLALENGRPADDLLKRLDTAEMYLKENPEAVLTAQRAGFTAILRYPAPSSPAGFGANVMWEVIAELSGLLRKL